MQNFLNMAGMKKEDVENMASKAGCNLPQNAFENMMNGDFSAFKNMDCSKFTNEMKNGNGNKCNPRGYIKKRAHFISGSDPEEVYSMTAG